MDLLTDEIKVKQAVKEALMDKRLDDLAGQINALSQQITTGFTAVHTRQDMANGKLQTHELKLTAQETKGAYDKLIWLVLTTLVGVVVFFLTKGH